MAIEASGSKFKRNNMWIYIVVLLALAVWCAYDGYINEEWIAEHKDADGNPEAYLLFNRYAPPVLVVGAIFIAGCLLATRNKKLIADED